MRCQACPRLIPIAVRAGLCFGQVAPADEALLQDTRNVDMALRRVAALGAAYRNSGGDQPFYMAVGLHRPHMRWSVPERFLDRQRGVAEISLATHQIHQQGVTPWAFYNCTALFKRKQVEAYVNISAETGHGNVADPLARTIRRYYYAAVMYADEQVGRLLDGLDRAGLYNTTLVVLHSDHGARLYLILGGGVLMAGRAMWPTPVCPCHIDTPYLSCFPTPQSVTVTPQPVTVTSCQMLTEAASSAISPPRMTHPYMTHPCFGFRLQARGARLVVQVDEL